MLEIRETATANIDAINLHGSGFYSAPLVLSQSIAYLGLGVSGNSCGVRTPIRRAMLEQEVARGRSKGLARTYSFGSASNKARGLNSAC